MNKGWNISAFRKYLVRAFPWLFLFVCFSSWVIFFVNNAGTLVDSDMSSELVLAHHLAETDDFLLSDGWFYSTEIRILHQQAVFSILFHFFDDWLTVRIVGSILLYIAYLASWYFLCCRAQIRSAFPITAGLLMIPFSEAYGYIILFGAFYIPHMILIFLILGILLGQIGHAHQPMWLICVGAVLSFAAGLGGLRLPLLLFMPIGCMAALQWIRKDRAEHKPFVLTGAALCLAALAGYVTNACYLSKHFLFETFSTLKISTSYLNRTSGFFWKLLYALSDRSSSPFILVASFVLIVVVCCFIMAFRNRKIEAKRRSTLAAYIFLSAGFFSFACLFTSMTYVDWYFIPVIILFIPLVYIAFKPYSFRKPVYVFMTVLVLLCGIRGYVYFDDWRLRTSRISSDMPDIAEWLSENEYYSGYATFWNANVLTELTDGKVEVWTLSSDRAQQDKEITLFDEDNIYKWLQLAEHQKTKPEGKVFLLMYAGDPYPFENSADAPVVYQSANHKIYDVSSFFSDK